MYGYTGTVCTIRSPYRLPPLAIAVLDVYWTGSTSMYPCLLRVGYGQNGRVLVLRFTIYSCLYTTLEFCLAVQDSCLLFRTSPIGSLNCEERLGRGQDADASGNLVIN
jgi:hypothetical protein